MKILWTYTGFWGSEYVAEIIKKEGHSLNVLKPKNLIIKELSDLYFIYDLKKCLSEQPQSDVLLHVVDLYQAYILSHIKNQKNIVSCYDIIPAVIPDGFRASLGLFKFNLNGLRSANKIIVPSISTKKDLIEYAKILDDQVAVIPFGVEHKIFKLLGNKYEIRAQLRQKYKIPEKDHIVLYVGGDYPRKNVPTLLKAFTMLKDDATLIKIGGDLLPRGGKKSINLMKKLGIQHKIIDIPREHMKNLPVFYNAADVFVFPSYYEGFGIPNLEAMACGCPVVTTNCSSIPEVVGDAAIKINDPFDYKLLADKIKEVLTNEGLRLDMIKKGLIQARKFSWEKYANGVYDVYKEVWNAK